MASLSLQTSESYLKIGKAEDGADHFPVVFKKTIQMWLTEPNISKEDLGRITVPTLVMAGDRNATVHEHIL